MKDEQIKAELVQLEQDIAKLSTDDLRAHYVAVVGNWKMALAELDETKDYLNALFVIIRDFLPVCPAKNRVLLEQAIDQGREIRVKYRQSLENELLAALAACEAAKGVDFDAIVGFLREAEQDHQGDEYGNPVHFQDCSGCEAEKLIRDIWPQVDALQTALKSLPEKSSVIKED
jgi:hypothetical protein